MDIFRRGSWERKEKSDEDDKRVIASLRERIKDLELQLFDLKKKNEELEIENNQLKVWNTCENNDWLMKLTRHSSLSIGKSSTAGITDTSVDVSVMTSTATSDSSHHISRTTKINRQNTIIFTDKDTDFDSFKINKLDIQMKCQVGKGSFGVVWKGVYKESQVAVKLFVSEEIDIRSEVYAMSKVAGMQHVMDLIGVVEEPGDAFKPPQVALVMPFMSNGSLQDICYKNSPTFMSRLTNEMKIKFCHQAAKGISQLHHVSIIHRDLACRNLLVDDNMDVFVADFGFARLKRIAESKGFTMTGLGPVRWEAPESLQFKEYSEKTDAFSFAVCLYEIVVGNMPWEHLSTAMVAVNVINGLRMIIPINCDPVLADVMHACWNPSPSKRPDFASIARTLGERHQEVLAEDKESERNIGTIEFMIRGENVYKLPHQIHKKKITKKPQQRYLRLSSDLKNIFWRSSAANSVFSSATRNKATERGVLMSDILDVRAGQTTETFKLQQAEMPMACSFSLITAERSVDVVCESSYHRDLWVAGMRLLMTRHKPSIADVELSHDVSWSLTSEMIQKGSFGILRRIAHRLQRGDMLLKFTSRKAHARHVFLSNDLTELVWSVKEEEGPVKKGRNKSLLLSEIDQIIVGMQPSRFQKTRGKQVSATAARLSEKLTFRQDLSSAQKKPDVDLALSSTRVRKNQLDFDEHSQQSGPAKSSILSRLFKEKEKDDRERDRKGKDRRGSYRGSDVSSVDDSLDHFQHRSQVEQLTSDKDDLRSETDSALSNVGQEESDDHQFNISFLGSNGISLLSIKCPNKECLVLWSDGVDALLQGISSLRRMNQDRKVHSYTHPDEFCSDSIDEVVLPRVSFKDNGGDQQSSQVSSIRPFSDIISSALEEVEEDFHSLGSEGSEKSFAPTLKLENRLPDPPARHNSSSCEDGGSEGVWSVEQREMRRIQQKFLDSRSSRGQERAERGYDFGDTLHKRASSVSTDSEMMLLDSTKPPSQAHDDDRSKDKDLLNAQQSSDVNIDAKAEKSQEHISVEVTTVSGNFSNTESTFMTAESVAGVDQCVDRMERSDKFDEAVFSKSMKLYEFGDVLQKAASDHNLEEKAVEKSLLSDTSDASSIAPQETQEPMQSSPVM